MQNVLLGRTGLAVSELCLGTMSFGGDADEAEAARIFAVCRDAGISFFDCANIYNEGRAEEILGRLIAGSRDEVVIASKLGFAAHGRAGGLNRRQIALSVEASLRRLMTDRLDVLFVHTTDDATPIEETMRGLEDVVRAGKALYLGASNWAAWQVATANGIAARAGTTPFDVIQPMYSLVKRQAEVELLPMALAQNIAVTPYSPAAGGVLTGKYAAGGSGRLTGNDRYRRRYGQAWMAETATAFAARAAELGVHPVALAVAWVKAHPAVTAPLIGGRSAEQIAAALSSVEIAMTPELRAELAALSRTPPPATDRLEEQM